VLEKRDEFLLPLAWKALPDHLSRACVECGKKIEGAIPLVLVLDQVGLVSFPGRLRGANPRPWLKGSLFGAHGQKGGKCLASPGDLVTILNERIVTSANFFLQIARYAPN